jgi:hypothetical protein
MTRPVHSPLATLATVRALLLAILLFGLVGTATELVLTGHYEDVWQWVPLVVLAVAILMSLGMAATRHRPATAVTRLFQGSMVLLILSGALGSTLHYRANMEFKLEMDPSLRGFALFSSVIRAKTPPSLAPGTLGLLGLLGLTYAFRRDGDGPRNNRNVNGA